VAAAVSSAAASGTEPVNRFAFAGSWRPAVVVEQHPPASAALNSDWGVKVVRRTIRASLGSFAAPDHHGHNGLASFYWQDQMTANGERFDKRAMTAAHRTLPFGSVVRVTHVLSGRQVVVRINDRGPFKPGRIIDLSEAAADRLGFRAHGLAHVQLEVLKQTP